MRLSVQLALGDHRANPFLSSSNSSEPPKEPPEPLSLWPELCLLLAPVLHVWPLGYLTASVQNARTIMRLYYGTLAFQWCLFNYFDWWFGIKINEGRCIRTAGGAVVLQSIQLWISNLFKSSLKCKRRPQAGYHNIFQCHLTSVKKRMSPLSDRFSPSSESLDLLVL